jgi:hypothetical protein
MNEFISENIITIVAVVFVFEVLMGMLSQHIAEKKGHSKRWFWAGFLLSLAGAIWAAGLPDEALRRQLASRELKREETGAAVPAAGANAETCAGDGELAAVLAAAAAAMGGEEGKKFVMRSFRPSKGSTAWGRAGRGRPPPARR